MSKMNDMAMTIEELRNAAAAINDAANWLAQQFSSDIQQQIENIAANKEEKAKPALTLEEVRAVLADKSRAGHTAEIRELLKKYGASKLSLVSWANDIKEYALQQAISGKEWTGWKLVEGRSNRRYTNEDAVSKAVEAAGFDPYEKKLLGITAMQKLLGKSRFEDLLEAYIEKPQGKPTLVPESDKRPAMNTAKNDFMEEYDNE